MDWQLTCRVCLESGDMVSLFDSDDNNELLSDKYAFCCGVYVKKNDNLPTLICLNCVDKLTLAHQFKEQCLSSNETLKECAKEYQKTISNASEGADTEMITIKQENGLLVQYEIPIEHDSTENWTKSLENSLNSAVLTKAPGPRKRGRPRKYPNEQGQMDISPYQRKKPKSSETEPDALTTMLANGTLEIKNEPEEYEEEMLDEEDPDFEPYLESDADQEVDIPKVKKRGRPRKNHPEMSLDTEDILFKEAMLASTEPLADNVLRPKTKKNSAKKKYVYAKTHTCETCGASFTSNASLQAHIRRHLGIKPFVCSVCGYACVLNMELRRHMMRHTGVKPYKCRVCDRRFGDYGSRQKHERLHMGIRPYQCSLCGKSFTYSYVLANHMLTHTGVKKYSCTPCNKKFTKAHHLKYHNKVHHKELYLQQQLELHAKRVREQMNVSGLSGVLSVDGTLQLLQASSEDGDNNFKLQVVDDKGGEEQEDLEEKEKETYQAVVDMQAVVLDADFE